MLWVTIANLFLWDANAQGVQVKRENSLDHWDSDTLAYYLDNYPGYDMAVMFYASWDQNSRALAPYWNQIAHEMDAGSTQSKIIMSLFDCELNSAHSKLCAAAGITHYPTLMFIGSGPFYDTDPFSKLLFGKNAAGMFGESPIPNTVKYQGNWQYQLAISDWIKTCQALSRWHVWSTTGFGKKLRTFLLPSRKPKNAQLPIGVPSTGSSAGSSGGTSTSTAGATSDESSAEVKKWKTAAEDMGKVASRAAIMIESLLFGEDSTDMFTFLDQCKAWNNPTSYKGLEDIYRACVMETSLDYCQRLSEPVGNKIVEQLLAANLSEQELQAASENMEALIMEELKKKEPYCGILDECIVNNMKDAKCRPKTCPFNNERACQMLNSCQDPGIVKEYAEALNLDIEKLAKK